MWGKVTQFENALMYFFGAPYAVAVDSCTHGLELCLRYLKAPFMICPKRTYLSVPMLASKLNIDLAWEDNEWETQYSVYRNLFDSAVLWEEGSYMKGSFMCLSFQYQKHLSLGRGGMILCPDKESAAVLKRMSYDGREHGIPWRDQNIKTMGYHYYMTPETAELGMKKFDDVMDKPVRLWTWEDYPDLTKMDVFK